LSKLWWVAVAALAVGITTSLGVSNVMPAIAFAAATWLILGAITDVAQRVQLLRIAPGASLRRFVHLPRSSFGTTLAHAGLGVTIAGIAGMSQASEKIVLLHPGEVATVAGYEWRLQSLGDRDGPNYAARVATVTISRDGQPVVTLKPERRSFPVQQITTTEAKISTNGFRDLYAVLGDERDGGAIMRLHYNPLAPWIWLGALVMAMGGLLSLSDRRLRIGAPVRGTARPPAAVPAE
jgi:cytochrome c-type biogenesis protein CcmF